MNLNEIISNYEALANAGSQHPSVQVLIDWLIDSGQTSDNKTAALIEVLSNLGTISHRDKNIAHIFYIWRRSNRKGRSLIEMALVNGDMVGSYIHSVDLSGGIDLSRSNFSESTIRYSTVNDTNFQGANLRAVNALGSKFNNVNFRGANMFKIFAPETDCDNADFKGANLRSAHFNMSRMWDANFEGADLEGANLSNCDLTNANFRGANLSGANLRRAIFDETDLRGANLTGVMVAESRLDRALVDPAVKRRMFSERDRDLESLWEQTPNIPDEEI